MKAKKIAKKTAKKKIVAPPAAPPAPLPSMRPEHFMADTFNVIHCRIALNDGINPDTGDMSGVREQLYQIIGVHGWERTFQVLASCMRLFAEVPTPLPKLSGHVNGILHTMASGLDKDAMNYLRHVDRESTKGHKI